MHRTRTTLEKNDSEGMKQIDQRLVTLLRCPTCNHSVSRTGLKFIQCSGCGTLYPLIDGTPILYEERITIGHLLYDVPPQGVAHPDGRLRKVLRALRLENPARMLANAYSFFDSRITPLCPVDPLFWMRRVEAALPAVGPKNVLDFGGGSGPYRPFLASAEDLYVILEVDWDSYQVRQNRLKHQYVIGDGQSQIFADESFDVIAMFQVLEHTRDPFAVISNCARWLKPGGHLVVSAPQYWHVHAWPHDYFRYTLHGLEEICSRSGLILKDGWPMGGPCVLIWTAIELNFALLLRLPVVKQIFSSLCLLAARFGDSLLFRNNLRRRHPDTVGWMIIAAKPMRSHRGDHS
jgi:SAM-dependent methyltransferase/uncharacterized protein YbaR (Trm112 family)